MSATKKTARSTSASAPVQDAQPSATKVLTAIPLPPELGKPALKTQGLPLPLRRISVRGFSYEEVLSEGQPINLQAGKQFGANVQIRGRVSLFENGCEVGILLQAEPTQETLPIRLSANVSAFFGRVEGITNAQLVKLAAAHGPVLLVPYLRQLILNMTRETVFGVLEFDPITVQFEWPGEVQAEQAAV